MTLKSTRTEIGYGNEGPFTVVSVYGKHLFVAYVVTVSDSDYVTSTFRAIWLWLIQ
jgi:hypothetical protein